MAKDHCIPWLLLIPAVCLCHHLFGASLIFGATKTKEAKSFISGRRSALIEVYSAEVGIREKTGNNDGKRVEEYLKYTGLSKGYPWCSAFVSWCLGKAGFENPRSAFSPSLFPKSHVIWIRGSPGPKKLLRGDVFGLYFPEKGRIAHVGFIDQVKDKMLVTVEGNTNEAGSREGDGVYRKRRMLASVYSISRWN